MELRTTVCGLVTACLLAVMNLCIPSIAKADHISCAPQPGGVNVVRPNIPACPFFLPLVPDPAKPDPTVVGQLPGPFSVGLVRYSLDVNFEYDSIRSRTQGDLWSCARLDDADSAILRASILYPARNPIDHGTDIEEKAPIARGKGRFPLVIFVHGAGIHPDRLDFALKNIVSQGAIAISLTGFNDEVDEDLPGDTSFYVECRAHLILMHLRFLNRLAFEDAVGVASNLGTQFTNRIDMTRIGLIGWSRGGEAVVIAALRQQADPFAIKGIISIAPSRNHPKTEGASLRLNIPWLGFVGTAPHNPQVK